jgi:hypothetical protein
LSCLPYCGIDVVFLETAATAGGQNFGEEFHDYGRINGPLGILLCDYESCSY